MFTRLVLPHELHQAVSGRFDDIQIAFERLQPQQPIVIWRLVFGCNSEPLVVWIKPDSFIWEVVLDFERLYLESVFIIILGFTADPRRLVPASCRQERNRLSEAGLRIMTIAKPFAPGSRASFRPVCFLERQTSLRSSHLLCLNPADRAGGGIRP